MSNVVISINEFRAAAIEFLRENAEEKPPERKFVWGEGSEKVAIFEECDPNIERALLSEARKFVAKRFDAGFGWITGPSRYGGRELPASYQQAYASLEARFNVPDQLFFLIAQRLGRPDHSCPRK